MKYLFGPVNSRRLGLSQGIDLVPEKICNFNCIYCEVGATTNLTCERKEYIPEKEILAEVDELLTRNPAADLIDVFTITGSGEPTLHSGISRIIRYLKTKAKKPVAVLTNGSLLHLKEVREDLMEADIIIPSLDAALQESFRKINRPSPCIELEDIISGMQVFSKEFHGQFWLEVLLAKGINDTVEDIDRLLSVLKKIQPERIQLNTVARPPLERFALPLNREELEVIAGLIAENGCGKVEILAEFEKRENNKSKPVDELEILQMLKRRPCTASDISEALSLEELAVKRVLQKLEKENRIYVAQHNGNKYFQYKVAGRQRDG